MFVYGLVFHAFTLMAGYEVYDIFFKEYNYSKHELDLVNSGDDCSFRAEIRDQCIEDSERHIKAAPNKYKKLRSNEEQDLNIWISKEADIYLTVLEVYTEEIPMAAFRAYYAPDVWETNISTLDSASTASKLKDQTNCTDLYLMKQQVKTPIIVADRVLF